MPASLVDELDRIAERVATLTRVVHTLREENRTMQITIDQRDGENRQLRERLDTVRGRVESLIARMPAE